MYEQIINLLKYSREEISVALKRKIYHRFGVNMCLLSHQPLKIHY